MPTEYEAKHPLVSIVCVTYNHKNYIAEAIEGFLAQKTNFPFELVIHDDASTDGTQMIVKDYQEKNPDLIKPVLQKENQYALGRKATPIAMAYARGKYIALCEGDDYWTDPAKLQLQFDFMEQHPHLLACWTRYQVLTVRNILESPVKNRSFQWKGNNNHMEVNLENLFQNYPAHTSTAFFKREAVSGELDVFFQYKHYKDIVLYSFLLNKGSGAILNRVTSVYRIHNSGVWSSNSRLNNAIDGLKAIENAMEIIGDQGFRLEYARFERMKQLLYAAVHTRPVSLNLVKKMRKEIAAHKRFNIKQLLRISLQVIRHWVTGSISLIKK